jgi:hypothetical protein
VTAGGTTVPTDSAGCAVFANLDPGTTAVSWDGTAGNYVGRNGEQTRAEITENVVIGSGQTSQLDRLFDRAGRFPLKFVDEAGSPVTWNTASVSHSSITKPASQVRSFALDSTLTIPKLFPFLSAYSVFAGSCTGNNPAAYLSTYPTPTAVAPAGAAASPTTVTVPTLLVFATDSAGAPAVGDTVTVKPGGSPMDASCPKLVGTNAKTTTATAATSISLPYGIYSVCVQAGTGSTAKAVTQLAYVTPPASPAPNQQSKAVTTYTGPATAATLLAKGSTMIAGTCPTS